MSTNSSAPLERQFAAPGIVRLLRPGAPRILVADDHDDIRDNIERLVRPTGLDLTLCAGGHEALTAYLTALKAEPFDLIVLDYLMPDLDGREVALRIRRHEEEQGRGSVKLAFFTGYFDRLSDTGALALATAGVLRKPDHMIDFGARLLAMVGGMAPEIFIPRRRVTDLRGSST